jgi:hypothetical protein
MQRTTEALDHEWRTAHEHSTGGAAALARWRKREPALYGLADLGEVLACRQDSERGAAVLAALARLAPTEDLAARTLLQALLPGLVHAVPAASPARDARADAASRRPRPATPRCLPNRDAERTGSPSTPRRSPTETS